ncbi:uncharacterized protein PRCAT00004879001 [Priceomyces carsonii]|uniref:uncharacterized protein n=1 Tax=Priceomyces carsonii TaxID=28549 RepID=UPI002EDB6B12|nr:unnamed protein product [Priceomyces carsonii]
MAPIILISTVAIHGTLRNLPRKSQSREAEAYEKQPNHSNKGQICMISFVYERNGTIDVCHREIGERTA